MRRVSSIVVSVVLGLGLWAGGEGFAVASASPVMGPLPPSSSASCRPADSRVPVLTLAEARRCWPQAKVAPWGLMVAPGEYVVPHGSGWIRAGVNIRLGSVDGRMVSSRTALAYSCSATYTLTIQTWEQWLTNISFTTGNTVRYCDWAYNNWKTAACSGFGHCDPPVTGVIGNYTSTVNPWYNQSVDYAAITDFFYCRHYIRADMSWSAYCD